LSSSFYIYLLFFYNFAKISISNRYKGVNLELNIFKELLKKAGFNKKTFAEYVQISHSTVNNWGSANRPPVPEWVGIFLKQYIENKDCKDLKQMIKDSGVCS